MKQILKMNEVTRRNYNTVKLVDTCGECCDDRADVHYFSDAQFYYLGKMDRTCFIEQI